MRPSETVGRELWEYIEQHEAGRHHGVANLTMLSNRRQPSTTSGRTLDTRTCLVSISEIVWQIRDDRCVNIVQSSRLVHRL